MVHTHTTISKTAESTQDLGQKLAARILNGEVQTRVICCWGELGSGKTTFIQGFAKGLGITRRLLSPTFIIVRHYDIPSTKRRLYHFDLYRLTAKKELDALGLDDLIADTDTILCIEWPERLDDELPNNRIDMYFTRRDDGTHSIEERSI